ncbi:hypothetical protein [Streptomyces xanthochromogenes]
MTRFVRERPYTSLTDMPHLEEGLRGLEETRRIDLEQWLDRLGLDAAVFPAVADIGRADMDVSTASADLGRRNGVWVANGNLVPRHLGIPTVTVPMGTMHDTGRPSDSPWPVAAAALGRRIGLGDQGTAQLVLGVAELAGHHPTRHRSHCGRRGEPPARAGSGDEPTMRSLARLWRLVTERLDSGEFGTVPIRPHGASADCAIPGLHGERPPVLRSRLRRHGEGLHRVKLLGPSLAERELRLGR